jgi:hypothetical protein
MALGSSVVKRIPLCLFHVQVRTDVRVVKEALGLAQCKDEAAEAAALREVQQILAPHMGVTWPCGNPNNRTQ